MKKLATYTKRKKNKNRCFYCYEVHKTEEAARDCEQGHDVVIVPMIRSDLGRLVNFIATGEKSLITASLSHTLFRYFKSREE